MSSSDNEQRRKEIVRDLLKRPHVPGSIPFQRLQSLTDYDGDYSPADEGMHYLDNKK